MLVEREADSFPGSFPFPLACALLPDLNAGATLWPLFTHDQLVLAREVVEAQFQLWETAYRPPTPQHFAVIE